MIKFLRITFLFLKRKLLFKFNNLNYLFIVLLTFFTPFCTTPQVLADFVAVNSTTGCESQVVEFQDVSSGNPTSWLWDFGNGITSILKNPIVLFNSPGEYDVSLQVSNGIYNDTKVYNSLVKIYENPNVNINSTINNDCAPLSTSFFNTSSNNIISWYWDFGDGGYSNHESPSYTYENSGEYSVTLSVTDINNCQSILTQSNYILVKEVPVSSFYANNVFSCDSSELISFVNNSYNASDYVWYFDDGSSSNLVEPSKLFTKGVYTITLLSTHNGCSDTLVLNDYINIVGYENPAFSVDTNSGCEGIEIEFFNISNDDSASYIWHFDTISTSLSENPIQLFNSPGYFDITLTMNGLSGCTSSITLDDYIKIFASPKLSFSSDTLIHCAYPVDVGFIDSSLNSSLWFWDFGDGNTSNLKNPINTYLNDGLFDVSLLAVSDYGCVATDTFFNYIEINKSPALDIELSTSIACVGQDVMFDDISLISNNNWLWFIGEDSVSSFKDPIYHFSDTGLYSVSLISGINSCTDTIILNDVIKIIEPLAEFKSKHNCVDPLLVEFTNTSIGADNVSWDFGDGSTSNLFNPSHEYVNTGTYNVVLTVYNNLTECTHSIQKEIQVTKPIANFDYLVNSNNGYEDSTSCIPKRVYLKNLSQDWDFFQVFWSDGGVEDSRLDHVFMDTGLFDVTMIITDVHKCKDTFTINNMFHMYDLNTDFKISNNYGCDSLFVNLQSSSDYPLSSVIWDFGNGSYSSSINPTALYTQEGTYDILLYSESYFGCRDTTSYHNYIEYIKPKSNFQSNDDSICIGEEIIFQNLSEGLELSYIWDFGDGNTSYLKNPIYSYNSNGIYDITLQVIDTLGCSNKYTYSNYINVLNPTSDFSIQSISSNCVPALANFTNNSSLDAVYFDWNFGDGTTSNIKNPSHLFSNNGVYSITLVSKNMFGCSDTSLKINYVDVSSSNPEGSFTVSSNIVCNEEELIFTSNILNTDSILWYFGNGVYSSDSIVSYSYFQPGEYIPMLVLKNDYGCQSIITYNDTIKVYEIVVDAGNSIQICKGEMFELHANGNATNYIWHPPDSVLSPTNNSTYIIPSTSMTYYVYNSNDHCISSDSVFVEVLDDIPEAFFTVENFCENDTTLFTGTSNLINSNIYYSWSFGQSGENVGEILNIGDNLVSLYVENLDNGCLDTFNNVVTIFSKPNIDFIISDNQMCLGDTINLTGYSNDSVLNWIYIINEFDSLFSKEIDYLPLISGNYSIKLEAKNSFGCTNSISKNFIVNDNPKVDFISVDNCEGIGNTFIDLSYIENDSIVDIKFQIEDSIYLDSITNYTFDESGEYNVLLTAFSSKGCSNSTIKQTHVYPKPNSNFIVSDICENTILNLNSLSTILSGNIIEYYWIINNDSTISNKNTKYSFNKAGLNTVTQLNVSDFGCKSQITKKINVLEKPDVDFMIHNNGCVGHPIELKFNGNKRNIKSWNYIFGDGTESIDSEPIHIFNNSGTYNISLETKSVNGCINDTIIYSAINIFKTPYVNFFSDKTTTSQYNSEIKFFNLSDDSLHYEWIFENEYISNEINPTFTFIEPKVHEIKLKGTNKDGCFSFEKKNINIIAEHTFFAPSSFTPNNDGLNEIFKVISNNISEYEILIFNRWGELIFTSDNINIGWDGENTKGEILKSDSYVYQVTLIDLNNRKFLYSGEINLKR